MLRGRGDLILVAGLVLSAVQVQAQPQAAVPSVGSAAHPQGPPLEQYIHGPSENGSASLVVKYHADGTCDFTSSAASARIPFYSAHNSHPVSDLRSHKCTWRWAADGRFCFKLDYAEHEQCKNNGHIIGRVLPNGQVGSKSR